MRSAAAILLAATLASCGSAPVSLRVSVATDLAPGADFDEISVELRLGGDASGPTLREQIVPVDAGTAGLAAGLDVARFTELEPASYRLTVRLTGAGEARRRDVLVDLRMDDGVRVVFSASCDDVTCPPADAPRNTDCVEGVCLDPACLEPMNPACESEGCTTDAECPGDAGNACVVARCVSGTCAMAPAAAGAASEDDENPCTLSECDGAGTCAHPPVEAGATCPTDDNECTDDVCDGLGSCGHVARRDGTPWSGGEFALCCGGVETQLDTESNCGGCGIACRGGRACMVTTFEGFPGHPSCVCSQTSDCPGAQECVFFGICFCNGDRQCPANQRCRMMPLPPGSNTHNYCWY